MKAIVFTTKQAPYNAGEVAGFPDEEAMRLIEAGVAVAYGAPGKAPDAPPADKAVGGPSKRDSLPVRKEGRSALRPY